MKFNHILTLGDSFTYGLELDDLTKAWPFLLAQKFNCKVTNLGMPGSSNCKIINTLVRQDISQFDLVVIGWTCFDRIEIADEIGTYDTWPGAQRKAHRDKAPWRAHIIDYITLHHNDKHLYRQYLTYCILAQSFLAHRHKHYVMIDAFGNNESPERTFSLNKDLLEKVCIDNFLGWPDETMLTWTKNTKFGPGKHFLDQGHAIVAEKIYQHLITVNRI
jgi:hypothetical protein